MTADFIEEDLKRIV